MSSNKENNPLVSIGIANYQNEKYIAECIESLLAQTYNNIEIIICDDGSTDNSQQIIGSYVSRYPQLRTVLLKCNKGIAVTYNNIVEHGNGKYICIVDGDDKMFPDKIRRQVEFMEAHPEYDMCFHNMEVYDDDEGVVLHNWLDKYRPTRNADEALFIANWRFKKNTRKTPSGSWLGRASYMKNGRNDIRTSAFHEFIFVLGMHAAKPDAKWHTIEDVLGRYRLHGHNISRQKADWQNNVEQITVSYSLAQVKYPQFRKKIKNEAAFWWFTQFLYNKVPTEYRAEYLNEYIKQYGVRKYFYFLFARLYLNKRFAGLRKLLKATN